MCHTKSQNVSVNWAIRALTVGRLGHYVECWVNKMNNCNRIEQVFNALNKATLAHSELLTELRRTFPATKDFLIADHYENNKRDAAGNPIGGAGGRGSSCAHKPNGCMIQVPPKMYRLNRGGVSVVAAAASSQTYNVPGPTNAIAPGTTYEGFQSDEAKLADCCKQHIDLQKARLGDEYFYESLPQCVIDAVFSIGVRYEGVQNVVRRYCTHFHVAEFRQHRNQLPDTCDQQPISTLIENMEKLGIERFTREVFQNSQRTSAQGGILKTDAVLQFARVLRGHGIEFLQDVAKAAEDVTLDQDLRTIPGQSSGISIGYFFMLAGNDDLIKPDRWIMSFLQRCLGRTCTTSEAGLLLTKVCESLQPQYPHLTPRLLDNMIWNYERSR